jgi:hypothetical protein
MVLAYSFSEDIFPGWNDEISYRQTSKNSLDLSKTFEIKPWQKLRILDDELILDSRVFGSIARKRTGDSRWKVLEKIKKLNDENFKYYLLRELRNTTYSKDSKWVEESYL